jgi:hypothetical protein
MKKFLLILIVLVLLFAAPAFAQLNQTGTPQMPGTYQQHPMGQSQYQQPIPQYQPRPNQNRDPLSGGSGRDMTHPQPNISHDPGAGAGVYYPIEK